MALSLFPHSLLNHSSKYVLRDCLVFEPGCCDQAQSSKVNRPSCFRLIHGWMWLWVHYYNEHAAQRNNQWRSNLLQHEGCLSRIKHSSAPLESCSSRSEHNFFKFQDIVLTPFQLQPWALFPERFWELPVCWNTNFVIFLCPGFTLSALKYHFRVAEWTQGRVKQRDVWSSSLIQL